ncbi:hypothetical protein ACFLZG_02455 [Thermodesulfobacteriota bacterium]
MNLLCLYPKLSLYPQGHYHCFFVDHPIQLLGILALFIRIQRSQCQIVGFIEFRRMPNRFIVGITDIRSIRFTPYQLQREELFTPNDSRPAYEISDPEILHSA